MALVTWNIKYSVGVEVLDNHHKTLIGFLNELHAVMMRGQGESIASSLLCRLKDYTREHFPAEESILASVNFPNLAQHREYHRGLIDKLEGFNLRHENDDHTMYPPFLLFLRDWQICHLYQQDREYIPYLAMKKIN